MAFSVQGRVKNARQVKSELKSILIISFDLKRIVYKELVLVGQKSIPHTTVISYSDCVSMLEGFFSNFGDKRTGCCITTLRLTLHFSLGKILPKIT
jgi:hypothetical protein